MIFTEDPHGCSYFLENPKFGTPKLIHSDSPLAYLAALSSADIIVQVNSTFAFWGSYFSKARMLISPHPFYLSDPNWNKDLFLERQIEIQYLEFPKVEFFRKRILRKISQRANILNHKFMESLRAL